MTLCYLSDPHLLLLDKDDGCLEITQDIFTHVHLVSLRRPCHRLHLHLIHPDRKSTLTRSIEQVLSKPVL